MPNTITVITNLCSLLWNSKQKITNQQGCHYQTSNKLTSYFFHNLINFQRSSSDLVPLFLALQLSKRLTKAVSAGKKHWMMESMAQYPRLFRHLKVNYFELCKTS